MKLERILIPAADPKGSYLCHKAEIDEAIHRVLESGWYIDGDEVSAFEREFGQFLDIDNVVGTGSGTEALHIALAAMGVGPGDEVVTSALTFASTVHAIMHAGAKPVLADIELETDPLNWLDRQLFDVDSQSVQRVEILHASGEEVVLQRVGEQLVILGIPEDRNLSSPGAAQPV